MFFREYCSGGCTAHVDLVPMWAVPEVVVFFKKNNNNNLSSITTSGVLAAVFYSDQRNL
jgi:hypothetical protein